MEYQYFTDKDFKNCTPSCSINDMNEDLMILLDKMRKLCGLIEMVVMIQPFFLFHIFKQKIRG